MSTKIDARISEFFRRMFSSPVVSEQDVLKLGKENISEAVRFFRREADGIRQGIKIYKELHNVIESILHKKLVRPSRPASQTFPVSLIIKDKQDDIVPTYDIAKFVEAKSTSLNICGWCRYGFPGADVSIGSCTRHPVCFFLTAACCSDDGRIIRANKRTQMEVLLKQSDDEQRGQIEKLEAFFPGLNLVRFGFDAPQTTKRNFITPCFLWYAEKAMLESLGQRIRRGTELLAEKKKHLDVLIQYLLGCRERAEAKPPFIQSRPDMWFAKDDLVVVYVGDSDYWKQLGIFWLSGWIKEIIKSKNDAESIEVAIDEEAFPVPIKVTAHKYSRRILHEWEYAYLRAHTEWCDVWLAQANEENPSTDKNFKTSLK